MFPFPAGVLAQAAAAAQRPQDVFATTLYTGNGTTNTVTTGVDLTGGGLLWMKDRSLAVGHYLASAQRGTTKYLDTSTTAAEQTPSSGGLQALLQTGFTLAQNWNGENRNGDNEVAWSFKKAAKFYTEVVYTGNGASGRQIAHDLGIKPGMIAIKRLDSATDWVVYQRSLSANKYLYLDSSNAAAAANANFFGSTEPTASVFTVGAFSYVNADQGIFLARIWAHDPDTTNGIIQCGAYTTDADGLGSANLGWQPQFVLLKTSLSSSAWYIQDLARGSKYIIANTTAAEGNGSLVTFNSSGFTDPGNISANDSITYLAIRSPV